MICETIERELTHSGVSFEDFQKVVQRLLTQQVIYRDPRNCTEREIYDLFERIDDLVGDYLEAMGITLVHRSDQRYVIAYPPGADYPFEHDPDERMPALRARPNKEETGLLLVCRKLFEDALREGALTEDDEALVSLESVYTNYKVVVREPMPGQKGRREALFSRLKALRVLDFQSLETEEALVKIRSTITALTFEGFVDALLDVTGGAGGAQEPKTETVTAEPNDFDAPSEDDEGG